MRTTVASAGTSLRGTYTLQYKSNALLAALDAQTVAIQSSLDATLAALGYDAIQPLYVGTKSYVCCTVPALLGSTWLTLTLAGAFGCVVAIGAFIYLGRIDALPRRDVCGCSTHTYEWYNERHLPSSPAAILPYDPVYDIANAPYVPGPDGKPPPRLAWSPPPSMPPSRESATMVQVTATLQLFHLFALQMIAAMAWVVMCYSCRRAESRRPWCR